MPEETEKKATWNVDEVADILGVAKLTIYAEIERGKLKPMQIGSRFIVTRPDLEEYIGKERTASLFPE